MTAGDAFIATGSLSGGTAITITIPSSTEVVVSAAGVRNPGNTSLGFDDGTNSQRASHLDQPTDDHGLQTRPVFDDSTDPRIRNNICGTESFHLSGREF